MQERIDKNDKRAKGTNPEDYEKVRRKYKIQQEVETTGISKKEQEKEIARN